MLQKAHNRVWIRDVDPYVFCEEYKSRHQRKGKIGAFELEFLSPTGESGPQFPVPALFRATAKNCS